MCTAAGTAQHDNRGTGGQRQSYDTHACLLLRILSVMDKVGGLYLVVTRR